VGVEEVVPGATGEDLEDSFRARCGAGAVLGVKEELGGSESWSERSMTRRSDALNEPKGGA